MKFSSTVYKLGIVLTCALSINLLVALKSAPKQDKAQNVSQKPTTNTASTSTFSKRRHVLKKSNWG